MTAVNTFHAHQSDGYDQPIDLFSNIKNQVIVLTGHIGVLFKVVRANIENNLMEQQVQITSVTVSPYKLLGHRVRAFPVAIEFLEDGEIAARFEEAGIVVAGKTTQKAIESLKEVVVELYDLFRNAPRLGPEPQHQLSVLEKYIV